MASPPFAVVLRISDVAVPRPELEHALGVSLARYEPARAGSLYYAQIDVDAGHVDMLAEDQLWEEVIDCIERLGPRIQALRSDRLIGRTSIDLAVSFGEGLAVVTYNLPSRVAETVGRQRIDLELSVYLGCDDDEL